MPTAKAYDMKLALYVRNAVRKGMEYPEAMKLARKKADKWRRDQEKRDLAKSVQKVMDLAPQVYGANAAEKKEATSDLCQFTSR